MSDFIFTQPPSEAFARCLDAPRRYGFRYYPNAPTIGECIFILFGSCPLNPFSPILAFGAAGCNAEAVGMYCICPCMAVDMDFNDK